MRALYTPNHLETSRSPKSIDFGSREARRRSISDFLKDLTDEAAGSDHLFYVPVGRFALRGGHYRLARYVFLGPAAGDEPIRLAIFAGIHGDEPEGSQALVEFLTRLRREPERARGYQIFAYPICNPSGFEDDTHRSRADNDLNGEFWQGSRQPEVYYLERELGVMGFHGIISLHSEEIDGVHAHACSSTLRQALVQPALDAAREILPRASKADNCSAEATGRKCNKGVLVNHAELISTPFEIVLETPRRAPVATQVEATVAALDRIVAEYRPFLATQQNI